MAKDYPYRKFEDLAAWNVVDEAIEKLERNNDLMALTNRRYIVGFVVKKLIDKGLIKSVRQGVLSSHKKA
jgi:hypothetical protein